VFTLPMLLEKREYFVLVATFEPSQTNDFELQVYSEAPTVLVEM